MWSLRALALLLISALLSGCFFEKPLTDRPSKDINTWLLGVWEHQDEKGNKFRAGVTPLTGGRYAVWFRALGKTPRDTKEWEFEAWISRVGSSVFLNFECLKSAGQVPVGSFVFAHYQVIGQNEVVIRPLQLDLPDNSTSYDLRREVRRKLKDKTLLPTMGAGWTRISQVYWNKGNEWSEQQPQPLNFPY